MLVRTPSGPLVLLLLALSLLACGEPLGPADAGRRPDASRPRADAGRADASTPDAAVGPQDAGVPDAGEPLDATWADGGEPDAAPADAEQPAPDAGLEPDVGADPNADAGSAEDATAGHDAAEPAGPDAADPGPDAAAPGPDAGCELCTGFSGASIRGLLPAALPELSGLAASRAHPGVLFAHNDSGDTAHFFAVDQSNAALLGEYVLTGATANDWEDLALGPCPTGTCLYLADHGDNLEVRTDYAVFRVPEPDVAPGQPAVTVGVSWERLPFEYPGGAKHNAETLLVHPGGDVYVLTKPASGVATAFKFPQPLTPGVKVTLVEVATLAVPRLQDSQLTGGDLHPCGDALLLRTYLTLFLFQRPAGQPFEATFTAPFQTLPVALEKQGEAVTWQADGAGYVTASEGTPSLLNVYDCQ